MAAVKSKIKIPKGIFEELALEGRIVLPDETRGLFPLPVNMIKNEAFMKRLASNKEFLANYEVAIITKHR